MDLGMVGFVCMGAGLVMTGVIAWDWILDSGIIHPGRILTKIQLWFIKTCRAFKEEI